MSQESVLADLQARTGEELLVSGWVVVEQERINRFADATGDHQWIHVDPERARRESPYKETVAHGFLTLSMISGLMQEDGARPAIYGDARLSVNYGLNRVRFPAPVRVNTRVRARVRLKEAEAVSGGVQVVREVTIEAEGEEKPACVAELITRLYW